jgi:hypothetical protein
MEESHKKMIPKRDIQRTNEHNKMSLILIIIRVMQNKIKITYKSISTRKSNVVTNNSAKC